MAARVVISPVNRTLPVHLLNPAMESVVVYKGTWISCLEALDESDMIDSASVAVVHQSESFSHIDHLSKKQQPMWDLVEKNDHLDENQREQLYCLLLAYEDIFARDKTDFDRKQMIRHAINTGDATPIRQHLRRIAPYRRKETQKLLQDMSKKDVIKSSTSPWVSPIILVRKKDMLSRFCVDYRKVNAVTRKEAYPLQRVDDTLDTLSGSRWFTTLDLSSGTGRLKLILRMQRRQHSAHTRDSSSSR